MTDVTLTVEIAAPAPTASAAPGIWIAAFSAQPARGVSALRCLDEPGLVAPASAENRTCRVLFDGTLYNRAELIALPIDESCDSANDASLVLRAYNCWGAAALRRIKGIFTCLIWDSQSNTLLCAHDPLGTYPAFYADAGAELLISTSIDALVRRPGVAHQVNREVIADYLRGRYPNPEETFFDAISRVPPGHALRVADGRKRIYRSWGLDEPGSEMRLASEDELEQFDHLLEQAIDRCLESGPAGIFLSGGLDSVSIAAFAVDRSLRRELPAPWALSLAFPGPDVNEEVVQHGVAQTLGLPQLMVPLDQATGPLGLVGAALRMNSRLPAPIQHFWLPAYCYLGAEARRRGCRVIMTGGGGDEWLTVDPIYAADLIAGCDAPKLYQLLVNFHRSYKLPLLPMLRSVLWTNGLRPLALAPVRRVLRRAAPEIVRSHRRRRILQSTPDWVVPDARLRRAMQLRTELSIDRDLSQIGSERLGFYWDRARSGLDRSMLAMENEECFESWRMMGVRELLPFWDPDLIKLLYRIPPEFLNRGGRSKGLVRDMLARRFPHLGFERQKKVVAIDFFRSAIMRQGPGAWKELGGAPALAGLGIVDARKLSAAMEQIFSGNQIQAAGRVWDVLNVEAWLQAHS